MQPKTNHFAGTGEEAEVQVHGVGGLYAGLVLWNRLDPAMLNDWPESIQSGGTTLEPCTA